MLGVVPVVMAPCEERDIPILWRTLQRFDAKRDYRRARAGLFQALGLRPAALHVDEASALAPGQVPPARFPPRLARLDFVARIINSTEVIVPPMCDVRAGEFLMGSDPSRDSHLFAAEEPEHWVKLPAYAIGRYPVTVAEYACMVRAGHPEPPPRLGAPTWAQQLRRPEHPVVNIVWPDAVAYAAWLAQLTAEPWRLPTEAEWEKAAKWEPAARMSLIYPWGDVFDKTRCNTFEGEEGTTTPVGSYPAGESPYGALDLAGNVWEWTSSLCKPYPYCADDGREAAASGDARVQRGGSWDSNARFARAAYRIGDQPGGAYIDFDLYGFRVARGGSEK
jgi:formylglycine-generating enzyme required for sulfatase activity